MGKTENKYAFPKDIEENILSRLPVKTILRFMSGCKSWYSLFLNPYFINIHIKNHSDNLLLMHLRKKKGVVVKNPSSSAVLSRLFVGPQMDTILDYETTIAGSCNGIVCLHFVRRNCYAHEPFKEYFYLWNPALKIIKNISNRVDNHSLGHKKRSFVGFGFHNHSNDYKVVRFQNSYVSLQIQVDIYSLSSDSWKTVNVPPHHHIRRFFARSHMHASVGVYINGAHHWVIKFRKNKTAVILSFDMGEEVFREIVIPKECVKSQPILFNNNETLALLTFGRNIGLSAYVWVMKDYGFPESWTMLCNIDIPQQLETVIFRRFIQIKNEVIFSRYIGGGQECTIVFDIDKSEVKETSSTIANIEFLKDANQVKPYKESLLLLNSTNIIRLK